MSELQRIYEIPLPPKRPLTGHKGTFGRTLVIGGCRGMSGAIALAGQAALRSGTGLVFLAVPDSIADVVAMMEPTYQVRGLASDSAGRFAASTNDEFHEAVFAADAVGIGPGLGRSPKIETLVATLFVETTNPLVVDADALNAIAIHPRGLSSLQPRGPRILTPHPGEASRLLGLSTREIAEDRLAAGVTLASKSGSVVILKGHGTIVTDGSRWFLNESGNTGLAKGGSGDVLTGLVTGLLAQGMDAFAAAVLAVHVHGRAAELGVAATSQMGLIASDLPALIARVWNEFEQVEIANQESDSEQL